MQTLQFYGSPIEHQPEYRLMETALKEAEIPFSIHFSSEGPTVLDEGGFSHNGPGELNRLIDEILANRARTEKNHPATENT